jgi:uncharacterized small protein (DUF1192 family)
MDVQEIPKTSFAFVYDGPSPNPAVFSAYPADARKIKSCTDVVTGQHYVIITTRSAKSTHQIMQTIDEYNTTVFTPAEKIVLQTLPDQPEIVTFTNEANPDIHVIGEEIEYARKKQVNNERSTYFYWEERASSTAGTTNQPRKRPRVSEEADDGASGSGTATEEAMGESISDEIDELKEELERTKAERDAKDNEITNVKAELERTKAERDAKVAVLTEVRAEREQCRLELASVRQDYHKWVQEIHCAEITRMQGHYNQLELTHERLIGEIAGSEEHRISALGAKYKTIDELKREITAKDETIAELMKEITKLKEAQREQGLQFPDVGRLTFLEGEYVLNKDTIAGQALRIQMLETYHGGRGSVDKYIEDNFTTTEKNALKGSRSVILLKRITEHSSGWYHRFNEAMENATKAEQALKELRAINTRQKEQYSLHLSAKNCELIIAQAKRLETTPVCMRCVRLGRPRRPASPAPADGA